jgi:hypothetical protein
MTAIISLNYISYVCWSIDTSFTKELKMKTVILITISLLTTNVAAAGYLGEWTCIAEGIKHDEAQVESRMVVSLQQKNDVVEITNLVGHVVVGAYEEQDPTYQYYSVFALSNIQQNVKYKPRVYTNHIQFKNIDTNFSSSHDGGGMWGEFVIEKKIFEAGAKSAGAHYIFKSGDHIGGTIDYVCKK